MIGYNQHSTILLQNKLGYITNLSYICEIKLGYRCKI